MRAPVASASCITRSPPTTRLSLLASARSMPCAQRCDRGPEPGRADEAVQDHVGAGLGDQLRDAVLARRAPLPRSRPRPPRPAACSSASATRVTPWRCACPSSCSQLSRRQSPTTSSSSLRSTTSSAWVPMDPVEPRMTISAHGIQVYEPPRRAPSGYRDRVRRVVADDHRDERGVEAVEHAAVLAEEAAGVLDAQVALDHRLEQVAERRGGGHAGADRQRVGARQPVLVEAGEPERQRARRGSRRSGPRPSCRARCAAPAAACPYRRPPK